LGQIRTTTVQGVLPPRLHLNYNDQNFAYILAAGKTLEDLAAEVKDNHSDIRVVDFWQGTKEVAPSTLVLKAFMNEINIRLNNEITRVYPNIAHVFTGDPVIMERLLEAGIAVNDSRILTRFMELLRGKLKDSFTDLELKAAMELSFVELEKAMEDEETQLEELQNRLKAELETVRSQRDALLSAAQIHADNIMKAGLASLFVQFGVIGYGTFGLYGWDVMEPVSYMWGLSWAWLGYSYFLVRKEDFGNSGFHEAIVKRKYKQLMLAAKLDEGQIALLEKRIAEIDEHLYNLR
jgi:hypothetical protein